MVLPLAGDFTEFFRLIFVISIVAKYSILMLISLLFLHILPDNFLNCINESNFLIGGTGLLCYTRQNCLCMNRSDPLGELVFHFLGFWKMKNYLDRISPPYSVFIGRVYDLLLVQYLNRYLV